MTQRSILFGWPGAMAIVALLLLSISVPTRADMSFPGEPVPLAEVAGKTGALRVTLTERSPFSAPDAIVKRMHLKGVPTADYDWAKEVYDLYIPATPGESGKYGVMVGAVFKDYGVPPGDWGELLEKHHVIWICSETVGEGQPAIRRIGTMLDAAHNVRKSYPVQDWRLYASMGTWTGPVCGMALHYADVFDGGAMYTVGWRWFAKVPTPDKKSSWDPSEMTPPDPEQIGLAKKSSRFFFVKRTEDIQQGADGETEIIKRGYQGMGFQFTKMITVPHEKMGHYGFYDPAMFEAAITFLDAPLATLPPKVAGKAVTVVSTRPAAPAAPSVAAPASPPKPAAPTNDAADKAAKDLVMAKNYLTQQKYDLARPRLQKIVETYPGTPAAKEAASLLKETEGK